jgi:hypothetical protein
MGCTQSKASTDAVSKAPNANAAAAGRELFHWLFVLPLLLLIQGRNTRCASLVF